MKKISLFAFASLVGFFLLGGFSSFTAFSAKDQSASVDVSQDRELAATIWRLTNRSVEGLPQRRAAGGATALDLEDRFQSVSLGRLEADGDLDAACVTSVGEANEFFGRNLETGEKVASEAYRRDATDSAARSNGMSVAEYEFYKKLIEDAAVRRQANPNAATISIVNGDGADEGFNDATPANPEGGNAGTTVGQQRLNVFNAAAAIWGAYLDTNVPISMNAKFDPLTCSTNSGVLGSAGTTTIIRNFPNAEFSNTWYHVALASKRAGTDLNGATAEINSIFNSTLNNNAGCLGGNRFYYGFDNTTPAGTSNLLIVLLHEMGHGLGFSSFINGSTGALNGGFPDVYTRHVFDRTTGKYWNDMTDAERQTSAITPNSVFWDGANVKSASGNLIAGVDTANGRVQIHTPATFASGGSISHWSTAASPNLLMEPNITANLPLTLDLTRQQMRDIGWYRDTNADLVPDTITNVAPSGGVLTAGSTVNITWTNTGGFNRNVAIELSTDGGATYPTRIAANVANTGSYSFTVPNTATAAGKIRVREDGFLNPLGASAANFTISNGTAVAPRTRFDFDGDGKADVSVFRPDTGIWYLLQSQNGFTGAQFGAASDRIAPADYDGDGRTDIAVYRGGTWYLQRSSAGFAGVGFGVGGDVPVPADFDGDGKAELAVFRPSNGTWYVFNLAANQSSGVFFGASEDQPQPADYDGDGRADVAVFRPSNGTWYMQRSALGFGAVQFGAGDDKPAPADYDGDGKTDQAVFRPSNGTWYLNRSQLGFTGVQFGATNDHAAAADYDGDGRADVAVFRPSGGTWYLNRSQSGFTGVAFGAANDRAVPSAYVP